MKKFALAALLLAIATGIVASLNGEAAVPARVLEWKPLIRVRSLGEPAEPGEARELAFSGRRTRAWTYLADVENSPGAGDSAMIRQARLIDESLYLAAARLAGIAPSELPSLNVVFDDLQAADSDRSGMVTEDLWQAMGGPTLVLDANLDDAAFVVTAIHELGHVMHRWLSKQPLSPQASWLEEGIARLFESETIASAPTVELSGFFSQGNTETLEYEVTPTTQAYGQSFLFAAYLFSHFGGSALMNDLLRTPIQKFADLEPALSGAVERDPSLAPAWLTPETLFTHFALALEINSPYVGKHQLFALGDLSGLVDLRSWTMHAPMLMAGKFPLKDFQARYFTLPPSSCWAFTREPNTHAYLLRDKGAATRIESAEPRFCDSGSTEGTRLVLVNLKDAGAAELKPY